VKLLWFDIDGTLLDTGGAGLQALREAFVEGFLGPERAHEFPELDLAGSTGGGIVRDLFARFHIPYPAAAEESVFGENKRKPRPRSKSPEAQQVMWEESKTDQDRRCL
jgi:phosphoglycolate phosphatase-like HAD superfamily hydrolase